MAARPHTAHGRVPVPVSSRTPTPVLPLLCPGPRQPGPGSGPEGRADGPCGQVFGLRAAGHLGSGWGPAPPPRQPERPPPGPTLMKELQTWLPGPHSPPERDWPVLEAWGAGWPSGATWGLTRLLPAGPVALKGPRAAHPSSLLLHPLPREALAGGGARREGPGFQGVGGGGPRGSGIICEVEDGGAGAARPPETRDFLAEPAMGKLEQNQSWRALRLPVPGGPSRWGAGRSGTHTADPGLCFLSCS